MSDDLQITPYLKVPEPLADPFIGQLNKLVQQANDYNPLRQTSFRKVRRQFTRPRIVLSLRAKGRS